MTNKYLPTSIVVDKQVPSFVRENHEKFVEFLQTYYEYLDQEDNVNDYIRNVISYTNIDTTKEEFLNTFFEELRNIPTDLLADKRLIANHIYDLYDAKGTPKAIELLFRILYNETVTIKYPSDSILRSSDGIWKQDAFFTLETTSGSLPIGNVKVSLSIKNAIGEFTIITNKIELDSNNQYRVYYNSNYRLSLVENQYIIRNDSSGNKIYSGKVKLSPSKLIVINGGAFWQVGTIIKIAGQGKDTYARVTQIGKDGALASLEVIQFGYGHSNGQIITITPFPNKPSGSSIEVTYDINTQTHTIGIVDYIDYSMRVDGQASGRDGGDYFAGDYSSDIYTGADIFSNQWNTSTQSTAVQDDISLDDWIKSKANISFVFDVVSKPKGEWVGNRGKISNPYIRLQDNSYYQLFSYVIKTRRCINRWRKAMFVIHPSGLKYFGDFYKDFSADVSETITASTTIQIS